MHAANLKRQRTPPPLAADTGTRHTRLRTQNKSAADPAPKTMSTFQRIPASKFGDPEFAKLNPDYFHEYVMYRVHGLAAQVAFIRVFGEEQLAHSGHSKIHEIEHNPWVRDQIIKRLKATPVSHLWNDKVAVHEILSIARDPMAKHSTRLSAMKELNVLAGITVTDDKGNTKRGMSLDEFYKDHGLPAERASNPASTSTVVSEPTRETRTTH